MGLIKVSCKQSAIAHVLMPCTNRARLISAELQTEWPVDTGCRLLDRFEGRYPENDRIVADSTIVNISNYTSNRPQLGAVNSYVYGIRLP